MYLSADRDPVTISAASPSLQEYPHNGYSVQCLILRAIAAHMSNALNDAHSSLDLAIDIALGIGLHTESFATLHGHGSKVLEESWRRTWWQLFVLDVMFAALNQTSQMRLSHVSLEVLLPCDEVEYVTEDVRQPFRRHCLF